MAYDVLAESRRLIADGLPDGPVRLSRRHRFAPVAVDVDGDIACTRFVRRGVGCFWDDTHLLIRDGPDWMYRGGGGAGSGGPWSAEAFEAARDEVGPDQLRADGGASVRIDADGWLPWKGRWLRVTELLAGRRVAEVLVDDRRRLAVPPHGHLVVVWASHRAPRVSARDAAGRELTGFTVPRT